MASRILPLCLLVSTLFISTLGFSQAPIFAADVFVPPAQTSHWTFQDGYGNSMTITIWTGGPTTFFPANTTFWSYDKSSCSAYPYPGVCGVHIDQGLVKQADGSYLATGKILHFPASCSSCSGGWTVATAQMQQIGGNGPAGIVIPARAQSGYLTVIDTAYTSYFEPGVATFDSILAAVQPVSPVHWRTTSYVDNIVTPSYSGPAVAVDVWDGACFDSTGVELPPQQQQPPQNCSHQRMYFVASLGLMKIQTFAPTNDRNLDMVR